MLLINTLYLHCVPTLARTSLVKNPIFYIQRQIVPPNQLLNWVKKNAVPSVLCV